MLILRSRGVSHDNLETIQLWRYCITFCGIASVWPSSLELDLALKTSIVLSDQTSESIQVRLVALSTMPPFANQTNLPRAGDGRFTFSSQDGSSLGLRGPEVCRKRNYRSNRRKLQNELFEGYMRVFFFMVKATIGSPAPQEAVHWWMPTKTSSRRVLGSVE